jgi:hypothetical protein
LANASCKESINTGELHTVEQLTNRQTKPLGWDAMRRRNSVQAVRNAYAVAWVKTHTLQDLRDLVNEMSVLGEDVTDISQLLDDLTEMDRSMHAGISEIPEACEQADVAG